MLFFGIVTENGIIRGNLEIATAQRLTLPFYFMSSNLPPAPSLYIVVVGVPGG